MKYFLVVFFICFSLLFATSIYDIQYTTNPGSGTFPSLYDGQIVTTGGIVTGIDYSGGKFFIASSAGGAWNGIYVYDNDYNVAVGDSVVIEAEVYEYYGFTELSNLSYCNIISSGNQLPEALVATTNDIASQEEFESVLVQVPDATVTQAYDEWAEWHISDGSGSCVVSTGFINFEEQELPILLGYAFSGVTGIVSFGWDEFRLNPRNFADLTSLDDSYIISISDQYIFSPEEFFIQIDLTFLGDLQTFQNYQFELEFDENTMQYTGYDLAGTLSSGGTLTVDQPAAGIVSVTFDGSISFNQIQTLLKLRFAPLESGTVDLNFSSFSIANIDINFFSIGQIILQLQSTPIGDTLTIIQKPISNIPQIAVPGDAFCIECLAEPSTSGWNAILQHQGKSISIDLTSTFYSYDLERWLLTAEAPDPDIYELYDLVVSADGIVTDTTLNAVKLIPEFKNDYYFVHITDSHLPTHTFYPDPQSLIDTTEVNDFREIIRDINLLNPEFVLFTGDLVNEGEMEDFENRRVYTKAQKLLSEFEVPVYLVSGNHDLGGWYSSPPVQGTARRNWWKFFGWNWLQNPPATEPVFTQNYSFDYGNIHYIGMEAYINYDDFMFNIYGNTSFTNTQMEWLVNDLQENAASSARVVYYHNDFSDQIDLVNLGIDMALYGHIHSNSGNLASPPYNISTESTCDGNRAYRVIYVEDDLLEPSETIYTGGDGEYLQATFTPENNGFSDSLFCFIENSQSLSFQDAQLKFIMPAGAEEYTAYNGYIEQVDESGDYAICYISFEIPANGSIAVSVVADITVTAENPISSEVVQLSNFPNPFNPTTEIYFETMNLPESAQIEIYNLKGQKVKVFDCSNQSDANASDLRSTISVVWDGTDQNNQPVGSGVYYYKLKAGKAEITKKMLLMK